MTDLLVRVRQATAQVRRECTEIIRLCIEAGQSGRAADFIASGAGVDAVRRALGAATAPTPTRPAAPTRPRSAGVRTTPAPGLGAPDFDGVLARLKATDSPARVREVFGPVSRPIRIGAVDFEGIAEAARASGRLRATASR